MSRNLADGVYCAVCHKRRPPAHFAERPDHPARPARPARPAQLRADDLDGLAADGAAWDDLDALAAEWDGLDGAAVEDGEIGEWDIGGDLDADPPGVAELDADADADTDTDTDAAGPSWGALLAAAGIGASVLGAVIGIPAALGTWQARRDAQATTQGAQDGRGW